MRLFLINSKIYGRKLKKWWKIRNFSNFLAHPVETLVWIRASVAEISLKNRQNAEIPINSHSNKNFILPFYARRGPPTPKREKTHSEPEYARMQNVRQRIP